jgi:hypothetical protein
MVRTPSDYAASAQQLFRARSVKMLVPRWNCNEKYGGKQRAIPEPAMCFGI